MTICFVLGIFLGKNDCNDFLAKYTEVTPHYNQHPFYFSRIFGVQFKVPRNPISRTKINMLFKLKFVKFVIFVISLLGSVECLSIRVHLFDLVYCHIEKKKILTIKMHDYRLACKHISISVGSTKG